MARRKKSKKDDETLVDLVEVTGSAQSFVESNQSYILGAIVAIVILVGGWVAYKYFYLAPRNIEAAEQMYKAQEQFERDSFKLALTNPGSGFPGFLDIADQYGGTTAGNTANYYAGISYLHLGRYDAAIAYLNDFNADDRILPIMKAGALGDAYSEKGELDKALRYYNSAVDAGDNEILTAYYLKKVGMLNEKMGNTDAALQAYETIQSEYPNSPDGQDIEKYILRLSNNG